MKNRSKNRSVAFIFFFSVFWPFSRLLMLVFPLCTLWYHPWLTLFPKNSETLAWYFRCCIHYLHHFIAHLSLSSPRNKIQVSISVYVHLILFACNGWVSSWPHRNFLLWSTLSYLHVKVFSSDNSCSILPILEIFHQSDFDGLTRITKSEFLLYDHADYNEKGCV